MNRIYSAQEAADEIGINARALRRHLRLSEAWRSAGFGGRYQFTDSDIRTLKRELSGKPRPVRAPKEDMTSKPDGYIAPLPDMIPAGTNVEDLGARRTKRERAEVEARFDARQNRLNRRLDELAREARQAEAREEVTA